LCDANIENQGIGSSTILAHRGNPNILDAIKGYTNFENRDFVLLEGFVNDWYYNTSRALLGTWKDTTESTVCGCVRSAFNYILSQNVNITIILILDPYGKGISADDAVNADGLTQLEYYEEIAKVAESMGIPVIKEYALSGINKYTTQYLIDNIHPTALGAEQSANTIWSVMRNIFPKKAS
jgi:hypothetical protein